MACLDGHELRLFSARLHNGFWCLRDSSVAFWTRGAYGHMSNGLLPSKKYGERTIPVVHFMVVDRTNRKTTTEQKDRQL
jgi:hypothetical protein